MKQVNIQIKGQVLTPEEFFNFVTGMRTVKAYRLYNTSINSESLLETVQKEIKRGHYTHYKAGKDPSGREILKWTYHPVDYSATREAFTKEWTPEYARPLNCANGDLFLVVPQYWT